MKEGALMSLISSAISAGLNALKNATKATTPTTSSNTKSNAPSSTTKTKTNSSSSSKSSSSGTNLISKTLEKAIETAAKATGTTTSSGSTPKSVGDVASVMKDNLNKQVAVSTNQQTTKAPVTSPVLTPIPSTPVSTQDAGLPNVIGSAIETTSKAAGLTTPSGQTPKSIGDIMSVMKDNLNAKTAASNSPATLTSLGIPKETLTLLENAIGSTANAAGLTTPSGQTPASTGDILAVMKSALNDLVVKANMTNAERIEAAIKESQDNQAKLIQQLIDSIASNMNSGDDLSAIYDQIISKLPQTPAVDILSYEDAEKRAKEQLNPLYDESVENVAKNMDFNNIQSGFYGQMPGDVLKAKAVTAEENKRASSISELANALVEQSRSAAAQAEQLAAQERAQRLSLLENLQNSIAARKQNNIQNLLSAIGVLGDQTSNNQSYLLSTKDMDLKEASFALDQYVQTGQLSLQEKAQILNEKKAAFEQALETDKWSYQKELSNRQMTLEEAQAKVDEAIKKGQLSLQQGQLALQLKEFELDTYKASSDVALKQQALNLDSYKAKNDVELKQQELAWAKDSNNPDNIYKKAQAKASSGKSETDQDVIDNMALAEARSQLNKNGQTGIQSWWDANKVELAKDLSATAYKYIEKMANNDDSSDGWD